MRRVWFWATALISLLFVVGESFLRKAIAVSLCGILSFNSTLCYANFARDSGESAIAALPPTEETPNITPAPDLYPYLQSTKSEFDPCSSPSHSRLLKLSSREGLPRKVQEALDRAGAKLQPIDEGFGDYVYDEYKVSCYAAKFNKQRYLYF